MKETWKSTTSGILTIIAGSGGIAFGILVVLFGGIIELLAGLSGVMLDQEIAQLVGEMTAAIGVFGSAVIGLGAVAIAGGIFALKRRLWGLALAGAICAIPCSPILGTLSTIFVSIGRKEFS